MHRDTVDALSVKFSERETYTEIRAMQLSAGTVPGPMVLGGQEGRCHRRKITPTLFEKRS